MSGRGWYYKQLYGGRGRGGQLGRNTPDASDHAKRVMSHSPSEGAVSKCVRHDSLQNAFIQLDGSPYQAYKSVLGHWALADGMMIIIDKIQADPFARPSNFRLRLRQDDARFPAELWNSNIRNVALCDYLTRRFSEATKKSGIDVANSGHGWSAAKGGDIQIVNPGQYVLPRTSIVVNEQFVEARCTVSLPARGRTILGRQAAELVCSKLPHVVKSSLCLSSLDLEHLRLHIECIEDQESLRQQIRNHNIIAFVGNGSVLPRRTGADDRPLTTEETPHLVKFQSPPSLEVQFTLPNRGIISGMGLRPGVTLIVGGGFHGKSTLLRALELGVYNRIRGDGREFVVLDPNSVKIRAEDGRSVCNVDISPFINHLPFQLETTKFTSSDSSGSTSQAANIIEALELGATTLLVDEDTCATNFMIRDASMQKLVAGDKEPITAFLYKVRPLFKEHGVSTIMVCGASGDFFQVANSVIQMDRYSAIDVTNKAKEIAKEAEIRQNDQDTGQITAASTENLRFGSISRRCLDYDSFIPDGKVFARDTRCIELGTTKIELGAVEQIVEASQTRAIAACLQYISASNNRLLSTSTLEEVLDRTCNLIGTICSDEDELCRFTNMAFPVGDIALARKFEIGAAMNRFRLLRMVASPRQ
eukprot:GHVT01016272.1.p1 GENE.GHVT01016272.1~~GHVT01016272.1.p1  ORF type:complete len:646 (-),score=22.36 GHVT01016272.1:1381-3318(-)